MEVFSFLEALPDDFVTEINSLENQCVSGSVDFYHEIEIKKWSDYQLAIISVTEFVENTCLHPHFYLDVRSDLYHLYKGNWTTKLIDLGNLAPGNTLKDTFFVLQEIQRTLMRNNVLLVILGGRQDLTYAQYRAFDNYKYMVNLVGIDAQFDIGDADEEISPNSYVSHMIVNQPYNLFNFSTIGYQTYYVKQEEKDLVEKLYFEAYRLGKVSDAIKEMEPILRDADLVSLDMTSIKASEIAVSNHKMVNGFTSKELCALARYAGLNIKNKTLGIYHLEKFDNIKTISQIAAQVIWYYIEGVNLKINEDPRINNLLFTHYKVPINNDVLKFYESQKTGKWWVEIPQISNRSNKLSEVAFLPCSKEDYLQACDQSYPERWFRAKCKNEL